MASVDLRPDRYQPETKPEDRLPLRFGQGNVDWQQRINWEELRKKRVARAQKCLEKWGIGSAIIFNHDRRRYLSSVWSHPYGKHIPNYYALFIRGAGFPYMPICEIDEQRTKEDCPWLEGRLISGDEMYQPRLTRYMPTAQGVEMWKKVAKQIKVLLVKHGVADLPISVDYSTPFLIHALENEGLTVVDGNGWIDEAGMVKFDEEVLLMKMAAAIHERGYAELVKEFRAGMRENEIQNIVAGVIYGQGAEYQEGWVINSGDRINPRSFNWSDRVVRPREFVSAEFCHINYCGYKVCYDRTFLVAAKPTPMQKEVYDTVVEMVFRVKELLKAGMTTQEFRRMRPQPGENLRTAEEFRAWRGKWKNHLGGMGIAWDSAPYWYTDGDPDFVLEKNMTIAYHAHIQVPGETGAASIENTIRITDTGCEFLTQWPYEDIQIIG